MSTLNFLERLLDGVAVEWKMLGEVATVTIGEFVHKNKQDPSAKYPVYNGGTSHTGFYDKYNNIGNKMIVSARGANAGFVNKISKPYWAGNSCYSTGIKNAKELNWNFVYYFLKLSESKLIGEQQKGGIPAVSKKQIETFQIPIPCPGNPDRSLAIQAEIVRILDTFTTLTAELTDRKKQYNYYRDRLLTFEEGEVEWKTLGEVSLKSYSGGTPTAGTSEYYDGGTIPWLRTQEVKFSDIEETEVKITPSALKNSAVKWIPENCVILAISGATAGRSAINKIPLTTNQHCCCLEIDLEKAVTSQ